MGDPRTEIYTMSRSSRRDPFRLGKVIVRPDHNTLCMDDQTVRLEPKVMDVLCCLADQAGQTLRREQILSDVWKVRFGGDESLTRAVSILRKSFRQLAPGVRVIETVSKRGYCLLILPSICEDELPPPVQAALPSSANKAAVAGSIADNDLIVISLSRGALAFAAVLIMLSVNISFRFGPEVTDTARAVIAEISTETEDTPPSPVFIRTAKPVQSRLTPIDYPTPGDVRTCEITAS